MKKILFIGVAAALMLTGCGGKKVSDGREIPVATTIATTEPAVTTTTTITIQINAPETTTPKVANLDNLIKEMNQEVYMTNRYGKNPNVVGAIACYSFQSYGKRYEIYEFESPLNNELNKMRTGSYIIDYGTGYILCSKTTVNGRFALLYEDDNSKVVKVFNEIETNLYS